MIGKERGEKRKGRGGQGRRGEREECCWKGRRGWGYAGKETRRKNEGGKREREDRVNVRKGVGKEKKERLCRKGEKSRRKGRDERSVRKGQRGERNQV